MAIESEELMLFEHIKKRIVKSLIEEILCLDPIELELVGHNIVSIIECKRIFIMELIKIINQVVIQWTALRMIRLLLQSIAQKRIIL